MPRHRIDRVLVIHETPSDFSEMLEASFPDIAFRYATAPAEIAPALAAADPQAVFSIKHGAIPGEYHRAAILHPALRWFHIGGSGYEHVRPWDRTRVTVTHGRGLLARYLAETVTGAMLALSGNFPRYVDQQRRQVWQPLLFRPLHGQTLLIVGLGTIGGHVADNAKALGMRVLGVGRTPRPHPAAEAVHPLGALLDVIGEADIVSVHLRLADTTRGLFDARAFQAMKQGAIFINTARGAIVDEAALTDALASGHLAAAHLDVFATEPLPEASPLWTLPNVFITPHAADNVVDWPQRFARLFIDNLSRWRDGRPLLNEIME